MPVASGIFIEIADLYLHYSNAGTDRHEFLRRQKKTMKIIVDSMWEQILRGLLSEAPRNALQARLVINERIADSSSEEQKILAALADLLKMYDVLVSTDYVDHSDKLRPVFVNNLRELTVAVGQHSSFMGNHVVRTQLAIIEGIAS